MKLRKFLLPTILGCSALALFRRLWETRFPAPPQTLPPAPPVPGRGINAGEVYDTIDYDSIDAYVEAERIRLHMPGVSLAIVEGDRIVHLRGFGQARPGGEPPSPQTPFMIASLIKSFTALAVMQLVEAGKIDLDAPVQRYLPWFCLADPQAATRVTVRHLLNQTSGFSNLSGELAISSFIDPQAALEHDIQAFSRLELTRAPGESFEYSNANYHLLGLLIEATSGETYSRYLQRHIFDPLEMRHSYTSPAAARRDGLAVGHQYWFSYPVAAPNLPIPQTALRAGLIISSAEDMAHYLIAHLNEGRYCEAQVLSPEGIAEMHRPVVDFTISGLGPVVALLTKGMSVGKYGMGWCVDDLAGSQIVWHGGTMPDYGAFMAILPEQKKGIVLLFNACHHWMNPILAEFGTGATSLLAGQPPAPRPFSRIFPLILRGQLLLPILQIAGLDSTLHRLRRWQLDPDSRHGGAGGLVRHALLPLVVNLLPALTLRSLLGKRRDYLKLYMPDYILLARVCGGFALVWSFLRTGLVLRALRKPSPPQSFCDPGTEK